MSNLTIRSAFRQALQAIEGLPASRSWEAVGYTPKTGIPYIAEHLKPSNSAIASLGGMGAADGLVRDDGFMQFTVFIPSNTGTIDADTAALLIERAFKPGTTIGYSGANVVCRRAVVGPGITEPDWYSVPITIYYYQHRLN